MMENDTFMLAPTSAGKSAIFLIPAILHPEQTTIVIEPTLALMHDQVRKLQSSNIAAAYIDSTMSAKEKNATLERLMCGKEKILYITPERFNSEDFWHVLNELDIFMVAVDEAHCVLDWGYSFREAYLRIGDTIDALGSRPVIAAFTATASSDDIEDIGDLLHMSHPEVFKNDLYRKNLIYIKRHADSRKNKQKLLVKYLKKYHRHSSIVYCNTHKAVNAVYEFLDAEYPDEVAKCHANMSDKVRSRNELEFLYGKKSIMVATTAFGMGVDLSSLDLVIHFNMPLSLTDYMQQSGRAGRNGQKAHCVLLYSDDDYYTNKIILTGDVAKHPKNKKEKRLLARLDNMKEFCDDTQQCIFKMLLETFGQRHGDRCNRCTNCQTQRRKQND